jgi:hypothetical protein
MHNGTSRLLYDVQVRSDSVVGNGSTAVTPAAFARKDVKKTRPSLQDGTTTLTLRDGSMHTLQSVKWTRDSATGMVPGPRTRIAIARRDISRMQQYSANAGVTVAAIFGIALLALFVAAASGAGESDWWNGM